MRPGANRRDQGTLRSVLWRRHLRYLLRALASDALNAIYRRPLRPLHHWTARTPTGRSAVSGLGTKAANYCDSSRQVFGGLRVHPTKHHQQPRTMPRRTVRGMESDAAAGDRGTVDKAQGGLRRNEAAALTWAAVQDVTDGAAGRIAAATAAVGAPLLRRQRGGRIPGVLGHRQGAADRPQAASRSIPVAIPAPTRAPPSPS